MVPVGDAALDFDLTENEYQISPAGTGRPVPIEPNRQRPDRAEI
jgi:hypothetical protein